MLGPAKGRLLIIPLSSPTGVDIEAARKEEERIMLRDARQWVNSGQISDVRHAKSGGTALHVAAAKGYAEVLK